MGSGKLFSVNKLRRELLLCAQHKLSSFNVFVFVKRSTKTSYPQIVNKISNTKPGVKISHIPRLCNKNLLKFYKSLNYKEINFLQNFEVKII